MSLESWNDFFKTPIKQVHMLRWFSLTFLLLAACFSSVSGLELKRVILSTNNDSLYIQFWPIVAPLWEAMGLRPTLALIAEEDCEIDTSLGDVFRFSPIPGVSEAMQAQVMRLLLPALFPDEGCLISDIDMLPISRSYFFQGAARCSDDAFLVYRDKAYGKKTRKYPMCYNAAKGSVFAAVFGISSSEDFSPLLKAWSGLNYGWNTDEIMLYRCLMAWEKGGGLIKRLGHNVGPRLDRLGWSEQFDPNTIGLYVDCHCPRPYLNYKASIDRVVEAIYGQ